jgi:hypothetical protein
MLSRSSIVLVAPEILVDEIQQPLALLHREFRVVVSFFLEITKNFTR